MMNRMIFVVAWAALIASAAAAQTSDPSISVEGGNIRGVSTDVAGVTVYKAVPFAAPPVGANRWKAPQPVVPWSGVGCSSLNAPINRRQLALKLWKC